MYQLQMAGCFLCTIEQIEKLLRSWSHDSCKGAARFVCIIVLSKLLKVLPEKKILKKDDPTPAKRALWFIILTRRGTAYLQAKGKMCSHSSRGR